MTTVVVGSTLVLAGAGCMGIAVRAQTQDVIKEKINSRTEEIKKLEGEISKYEQELQATSKEAKTLENAVATYNVSIKKYNADIALTGEKIALETATLEEIGTEITAKESRMRNNVAALAEAIRSLNAAESTTLAEVVLAEGSLATFWDQIHDLETLQEAIKNDLLVLRGIRTELDIAQKKAAGSRESLVALNRQLGSKKQSVEVSKREKNELLSVTKNQEKNYQSILAEKRAQKIAFERDLNALESQLKLAVDPSRLPDAAPGVLSWPLDNVRVTQVFGDTDFSSRNPQVYGGKGHNGVDFGAPIGTPVKSALSGTISGVGNTDAVPGCYSYGKWVMVKHPNGLSTLYAHLSEIGVSTGQAVETGEVIGHSGNTGYSTGPHLHFGAYATQGVQITKFEKSINCKNAVIPVADFKAYLNPLAYLPAN